MAAPRYLAWKFTRRLCIEHRRNPATQFKWFCTTTNRCHHQFALGAIAGFGSNTLAVPDVKTTNKKIIAMPTRRAIKSVIAFLLLIV